MKKTAVIIKGNPLYIEGNEKATLFYHELALFLQSLGFETTFDAGEPYTQPQVADVWIGHSRGADRLRFAPVGKKVIGIGVPESEQNTFLIVNHPQDGMAQRVFREGKVIEEKSGNDADERGSRCLRTGEPGNAGQKLAVL